MIINVATMQNFEVIYDNP